MRIFLSLIFIVSACLAYAEDTPALLAWYKLDGDFKDASGNGRHLSPRSDANIFSDAPQILGAKNRCFGPTVKRPVKFGAVGPEMPLDNKKGFTICGFARLPQSNSYGGQFFGCGSANKGSPGALLFPSWGIVNSKVGSGGSYSYQRFADQQWHHYALVVPPQGAGDKYSLYVDGAKAYSAAAQYLPAYGKFNIGMVDISQEYGIRIDEVKVFDGPLSEAQIKKEAQKNGLTLTLAQQEYYAQKLTTELRERGITIGPVQRIFPKGPVHIKGRLKIHFITKEWICVVGNYNDFMRERLKIECGAFFKKLDENRAKEEDWSYNFYYDFNTANVIASYRPTIKKNFETPDYFTLKDSAGKKQIFAQNAYWINAVGVMRVKRGLTDTLKRVKCAAVAHFAYFKLAEPLKPGEKYTLTTRNGEKAEFSYDERKIVSRTIKVNQVGYLPEAGRKIAYLGMWLATAGPLPLKGWFDKKFHIIDEKDNSVAYSGNIRLRMDEQYYTGGAKAIPLNGEQVCEMDFSDFKKPGKYHIYVPGIGRSWSFELSKNAIGRAFYKHIRGLFHQRSGIAKGPPHTNWIMGADHLHSWFSEYSPEDSDYTPSGKKYGYLNQYGIPVSINRFTVIYENRTNKKLNVYGGWWDAGDFQRRTFHFQIVQDLLSAYFMFPKKFSDGQQDIPESGNGVPDIIDEAAWGVEVWRKAQNAEGGVGCWLEGTSQPKVDNPVKDTQRFYLAAPTRHSTMQYAAHASLLARAYVKCGAKDKAVLFLESAAKAFKYAINPKNQIKYSWNHDIGGGRTAVYSFVEPPDLRPEMVFKAALNLYELTEDKYYQQFLTQKRFNFILSKLMYPLNPFFLTEILASGRDFFGFKLQYQAKITGEAQKWLNYQEGLAYRNLNFPTDHTFFTTLAWGNAMPFKKGRIFLIAYSITGLYAYRDAALLLNDWMNGCNPMGRSMTTGLGKNNPIRILSLPSYSDGILPPLPGITPYTFTFNIAYQAFDMVFALRYKPRPQHYFDGLTVDLMPEALSKGKMLTIRESGDVLDKMYPVWRRFTNIERFAVPQNEFTVWETIGPCAAGLACLLPEGWKPPPEWKNEIPAKSLDEMEGYLFQP
jgi:hypothetical protein